MRRIILALLLTLWAVPAGADTHAAATCERTAVQTAIDAATTGDTVTVPAGSCNWSTAVTVSAAISLVGAGASSTVITWTGGSGSTEAFVKIASLTSSSPVRISGFRFIGSVAIPNYGILVDYGSELSSLRVDNNRFDYGNMQVSTYRTKGVIDHNDFYNGIKAVSMEGGDATYAAASWASMAAGTVEALFVETNNIIDNASYPHAYTQEKIGTCCGGKIVVRYNTFDSSATTLDSTWHTFGAHGSAAGSVPGGYWQIGTGARRGQSVIEFYYNSIVGKRVDFFFSSRGGACLVHHNALTISTGWGTRVYFNEEEQYESSNWSPLRTGWPAEDQIHNSFIWANTRNGAAIITSIDDIAFPAESAKDYIQLNRDFFLHEPQATGGSESFTGANGASNTYPISGVYYPTSGTMAFSASGPNAYYGYVPYTYPHPLTGTSAPNAPTNVRIR